jgi:ATP-dependent RNA helicase DDX35
VLLPLCSEVPQYLDTAGWTSEGRTIVITQPRRVAAITLARRVADEMACQLGHDVGYRVRFDDCTNTSPTPSHRTRIIFMTDGMLLRELLTDPLLSSYSLVIVDEAHERSVSSDLLLALLRRLGGKRKDLRLIVQSATLGVDELKGLFGGLRCGVIGVEGRQWPVTVYYAKRPVKDYVQAAVDTVLHVHRTQGEGDVLVFMTGREEVDTVVAAIREHNTKSASHPLIQPTPITINPDLDLTTRLVL